MTLKTEEAIKIAEKIQKDIVAGKISTLNFLRQYYSLVILLDKKDDVEWALNELDGYKYIKEIPDYRKVRFPQKKYQEEKQFAVIPHSCGEIEALLESGETYTFRCVKLLQLVVESQRVYHFVPVKPRDFYNIKNNITNIIYTKTQQILLEIKFGKFEFDIFEETRKFVDTELSKRCPKAFEKLTEAYEDLMKIETPLDFQQTALACRVILKDFADSIYPASNKKINGFDGKPHTLKDDDYTNRIIACLQESSSSKEDKEFMEDYLRYLESYLVSIKMMANKGLHHENSREYANRCLIYTYLVLGDIIKLLEKQYAPIGI